ncbi:hypothetical protein GYMLUDRAFT_834512 [Collybiopsis luxurians FD-317 M1]|uniref:Uncharacterized protein n=1 Tax=Collybiopsis luxurians FD-317 M1 TaxID=944289 RepID=A0A0D0CKL3_9AGAR|nr:hypothetical protein GYMLUDRAFT_834512 [Collybiopsis luxurians FD-317 M1]
MPEIVLPLPLPPARPSRKDVVSPLPSPTLRRMKALESLPLKSIVSPPSPGHKPSASESSIGFSGAGNTGITHTHAHTHLPHVPSSGSTMLSAKKSIRKSSSFSSLPRFVPPDVDVPLPDASVLAKRTRKSSAPGVRPPIEDFQIVVTRAPDVSAKTPLVPVFVSGSKGFGGGNREDAAALTTAALTAAESIPSATVSMRALVSDALQLEAELAQKEHVMKDSSVPLQPVEKVTFPSVESRPQSPAVSVVSRASPIPAHKKGASLNHTETRPVLKAHKKSSSSVSFRPPFVEAPLPDATTLAKRLVTRKDSTSNGFRPPFVDVMRRKGSVGQDSRPHISSTTSDTAVVSRRQHQKAEERPVVLHSTSDMVIPYRPPVVSAETSTSTSTSSLRPSGSSPSHSRSASSVSSSPAPAPVLDARRRNGSISVRRPVIDNVPLPDTSVLALRFRTGSSQSSRPSSDASDAFSPSPVSVDKITASSSPSTTSRTAQRVQIGSSQSNRPSSDASDASDAFSHSVVSVDKSIASSSPLASRTDSASSVNTEPAVPLPAPKPVAVGASWIPQLSSRLTQPERPPAWVQDPQSSEQAVRPLPPKGSAIPVLSAGQHSRSRSGSIARAARVTSPPSVPSLPSLPSVPSLPSAPSPSRNSPPLQPPPKLESVMRTPSPSILIRNKAASPVPPSMHVRFRSIDKHPVPPLVVPLVEPVSNINNGNAKSRPSLPEIPVRGRQPTITRKPTGGGSGVVSPRRSASVAAVSRHPTSKRRSASIAATPRNLPHVPPPPSLPLGSAESQSPSESIASAGLNRGRISPFPTRPISRTSVYTARVGA